jgi:hypothetical protein
MAQVLDAIRLMTEAHESLRTTIVPDVGRDEPRQRVYSAGEIAVRVIDWSSATEGSPDVRHNFDLTSEYPVRWTIYCRDGAPIEALCVLSHVTIDGSALMVDGGLSIM